MEFSAAFEELFENKAKLNNANIVEKSKIIIMVSDFRKIREESIEKTEDICDQSTLVPIIYRSQFITKVHNVSYYMLQKNLNLKFLNFRELFEPNMDYSIG